MKWNDVSFSINGAPVDVSDLQYGNGTAELEIGAVEPRPEPVLAQTYHFETELEIAPGALDFLYPPQPAGASHATLVRRLRYGNRKGRAARRRLLARGLPIEITTTMGTRRGRAASIDATTFLLELQPRAVCK